MLKNTEQHRSLVGKYIEFLEYPDGTISIQYQGRSINYSTFNRLSKLNQREVVENKRLGAVLAHIQQQHEELEQQNKRSRIKKSIPSRKVQNSRI